jgi:signal transduction histidine kinase
MTARTMFDTRPRLLRHAAFAVSLSAAGLALALFGWSELETRVRQREIETLVMAEGGALAEALGHAVEHTLASGREIEELASARLLDLARLIDRLEAAGLLDSGSLHSLAVNLGLHRVLILDRALRPVLDARPENETDAGESQFDLVALRPLSDGTADEMVLGAREAPGGRGPRFAAAARRSRGGAVLTVMDAGEMLAFQESIGAANLMEAVGGTGGIVYAVLEDAGGQRLAGVSPGPPGQRDDALELTRPVDLEHGRQGRLRLGLSRAALDAATAAGHRRAAAAALVAFALASATTALVMARRRSAELSRQVDRESRRSQNLEAFGRLAAAMAHEIRNPLNAVAVGVQRLAREFPDARHAGADGVDRRRMTDIIRSEVERLDGIVTRFLDLARPPRLNPVPGDLDSQVRYMVAFLATGLPAGVRLLAEPGGLPPVVFDAAAIRQVLHNLVRNAVEAMGDGGTVRIATRREGRTAILEVSDDGPGIPPDHLDRVFEFGFSTRPQGNGMGLPIVHRLVEEMGGTLVLDSAPGRGTTMRIALPLAAVAAA